MSMTNNRADLSPEEKRALLAQLLRKKAAATITTHPLSAAQYGLYFQHNFAPGNVAFNLMYALRIWSAVDVPALHRAFQAIVDRHASLRTTYAARDHEHVQQIHGHQAVAFEPIDAANWSWEQLTERMLAAADQPFDLERGPLLRVYLFSQASDRHVLLIVVHHIAVDLWSLDLVMDELRQCYAAARSGTSASLPPLQLQYTDYVHWEAKLLASAEAERLWSYWQRQLGGAPSGSGTRELPTLNLPTDRPRPPIQTYRGAAETIKLSSALTSRLRMLARAEGATLYMVVLAAYQALLHRYSGQTDYCIGSPTVIRGRRELESIVGCFVNYVVLRADCAGNPSFTTLLRRVQATVLGALEHQAYPFNLLVERLQPTRDPSRFPLFQLVFIWDKLRQVGDQDVSPFLLLGLDETAPRMQWDELEVEALAYDQRGAAFDLMLTVFEGRDSLAIALKYNTDLFDADTIKRLLGHFETLLSGIVDQPEQRLAQMPLLTPPEQHEILDLFNATARPYPTDICYHQLFEVQAARTPDAVAVVYDDGAQMTYRELNEQANQLAHQLKRLGVGPGSLIAVYMDRSLEMITALLGIAKAGGAYVPQEPSFPDTRVSWILTSLGVDWIITQQLYQPRLDSLCPPTLRHVIYLDAPPSDAVAQDQPPHAGRKTWTWNEMQQLPRENLPPQSSPDDLAYIIFTSGSTGTPKGVMVRHRPVVNLIDWVNRSFAISAADRVLFITSLCFDLSVYDIFGLLAAGGSIRVVANRDLGDPQRLLEMLCNEPVTFWDSAPAALQQLAPLFTTLGAQAQASRLRLVFLSGDWIPVTLPDQVRATFPRAEVISLGGATEATVWSNYHPIATVEQHWTSIPYGKPIQNSQYYILDSYLNPCPVGIPGDLYIAGDCLASGYINEPILTAAKFIPNPFTSEPGSYLYKTGDQARFWSDGTMEFLGRIDHQVKIRGFRIELGEIEAVLRQHPAVDEAVVIAREDTLAGAKAKRLVAYVVSGSESRAQDTPGGTAELQSFVKARLPEYMVPAAFVFLERLPVTANGKLDRKALPVPEVSRADLLDDYVAPRTPLEAQLAAIWAEVLQLERVGVEDSFFAIGGHSLVATQIVVRVRDAFQVDVSLRTLLETQTVAALAETIAELQAESVQESSPLPPLVPLNHDQPVPVSFAQERLWFLDQLTPGSSVYVVPWLLRLTGPLAASALHRALVALAERHASLRTTFAVVDGQPVQVIAPTAHVPFTHQVVAPCTATEAEALITATLYADAQRAFDLSAGPLLRATLLQFAPDHHVLLLLFHHIVVDEWSLAVIARELRLAYAAALAGHVPAWPELPVQYADYAVWQRQWLAGAQLATALAAWTTQLAGAPALLALPTDRPRPPVQRFDGATHRWQLAPDLTRQLHQLSQREGATLFMTLLAAFAGLLSRLSQQQDLVIGAPSANRTHTATESLVGLFINTLPLRLRLDRAPTFRALLGQARTVALQAYAQQAVPFEKLVEALQPERHRSYHPLVQVLFDLHNTPSSALDLGSVQAEALPIARTIAKVDLSLIVTEGADGLLGEWEYNTDLFDQATIARWAEHFTVLLTAIAADADTPVARLPLLNAAMEHELLVARNATAQAYPAATYPTLFAQQVARTPDAIAVAADDGQLTYQELADAAAQLAQVLRQQYGIGRGSRVALLLPRSRELLVALLAVWQAGGAWVPLDAAFPPARIQFVLHDAGAALVLSHSALRERLPASGPPVLWLDHSHAQRAAYATTPPSSVLTPEDLAYLIYTSGSTGQPKGVLVPQRGLVNYLHWALTAYTADAGSGAPVQSSIAADAIFPSLFAPLLVGRTVQLLPDAEPLDALADALLTADPFSLIKITPTQLDVLSHTLTAAHMAGRVQTLVVGAEALRGEQVARWQQAAPDTVILNEYGPTETVVGCSIYHVAQAWSGPVPIGRPIANTTFYVLDAAMQPVPIGVEGELYIGGDGVAWGYHDRPDLTAARFVPDPFSQRPGARLYKTGDVVRWLGDRAANIVFVGRRDEQVKIRGYRVELAEVERALLDTGAVLDVAVVARDDDHAGALRLVAYVVPATATVRVEELRAALGRRLPDYMVPQAVVVLDRLPLTATGKLDRRALPAPDGQRPELAAAYVAPRTAVETTLAEVWQEVLHLDQVGVHDNFFALGGHSLLLTQLVARIRAVFQIELPLRTVFDTPTIAGLAEHIEMVGWVLEGSDTLSEDTIGNREEITI